MNKRQLTSDKLFDIANVTVISLMIVGWLYPLWYCIIQSLSNTLIVSPREIWIVPIKFTWINYETVFYDNRMMMGFLLSVKRTFIGATLSVACNATAAYALSKKQLLGRKFITTYILISMFFSGGLIPTFLLMQGLHLTNNFWGFIFPSLYAGIYIIIMRSFFNSIPIEMEESAKIDGANDILIFIRIYIPLSSALLATMFLFEAVGHWNDWFMGDLYMREQKLKPMATLLMQIVTRNTLAGAGFSDTSGANVPSIANKPSPNGIKMAAVLVTTIPILIVYPFLQKYFAKGVMIGSVKG